MKTLIYIRPAIASKDGANGFLYLHHFGTGWEELIFPTKREAEIYRKANNLL